MIHVDSIHVHVYTMSMHILACLLRQLFKCYVMFFPWKLAIHTLSYFSSFSFSHQGLPHRIFLLQLFLASVSSSVTSTSAMSSFTSSINLLLGLPRFLFPVNSILSILLPIYGVHHLSSVGDHPYPIIMQQKFIRAPS